MIPAYLLIEAVIDAVKEDLFWNEFFQEHVGERAFSASIHIAVFVEPYLGYVLDGRKKVESRFSISRKPPFGAVVEGDVLLLKRAGGPVVGIAQIGSVWSYELNPESFREIRHEFATLLCAEDSAFWESRSVASFATLLRLKNVRSISPIDVDKQDRRGWVVVRKRSRQRLLWEE